MKKSLLAIVMLALVVVTASCKKDKETNSVTLQAFIGQPVADGSRTSLHPNYANGTATIHWEAGDQLIVNNGTQSVNFNLQGGEGTGNGTFTYGGDFEFGANNVAVYPSTATIEGNKARFELFARQIFNNTGTFGPRMNPMLCTFTDPSNLQFNSLCGVLGISLKGVGKSIQRIEVVSAKSTDKLNGWLECTVTDDDPYLAPAADNEGTNVASISFYSPFHLSDVEQYFYFVLPEGTLSEGFSLNMYDAFDDGNLVYSQSTSNPITITHNRLSQMPVVDLNYIPSSYVSLPFSVSPTKQVYFSQGNLQATTEDGGTTWTWSFADIQYDFIDAAVANTSVAGNGVVSANGTVDLFGWSTAATCYGIHNMTDNSSYGGDFVDWGTNAISNGGTYSWRTLTQDEWSYLLNARSGDRFARVTLQGIYGLILFPDGFTRPSWSNMSYNVTFSGFVSVTNHWSELEAAGCVFLPITGERSGAEVSGVGTSNLKYWTSTPNGDGQAVMLKQSSYDSYYFAVSDRYIGRPVRLVRDVN